MRAYRIKDQLPDKVFHNEVPITDIRAWSNDTHLNICKVQRNNTYIAAVYILSDTTGFDNGQYRKNRIIGRK